MFHLSSPVISQGARLQATVATHLPRLFRTPYISYFLCSLGRRPYQVPRNCNLQQQQQQQRASSVSDALLAMTRGSACLLFKWGQFQPTVACTPCGLITSFRLSARLLDLTGLMLASLYVSDRSILQAYLTEPLGRPGILYPVMPANCSRRSTDFYRSFTRDCSISTHLPNLRGSRALSSFNQPSIFCLSASLSPLFNLASNSTHSIKALYAH